MSRDVRRARPGRVARAVRWIPAVVPLLAAVWWPVEGRAQTVPAAAVSPDTVRVGEPFTLGVVVPGPGSPSFPARLLSGDSIESLDPPRIESDDGGREPDRAYYRMVAWTPGRIRLPDVEISGLDAGVVRVRGPTVVVLSVLPDSAAGPALRLRDPAGPSSDRSFPWSLLVALLVLVALVADRVRRRRAARVPARRPAPLDAPGLEAREALRALREEADRGAVAPGEFYDRLEEILRRFLDRMAVAAAPASAPPAIPVRRRPVATELGPLVGRAERARFAAIEPAPSALVEDADRALRLVDAAEGAA